MASLSEIKNWFKTGLKPTQTQFWITWDSFWHKDTPIPQEAIENLENTLINKVDISRLEEHINDPDAHSGGGSEVPTAKETFIKDGVVDDIPHSINFSFTGNEYFSAYTPNNGAVQFQAKNSTVHILGETNKVAIYAPNGIDHTANNGYHTFWGQRGARYYEKPLPLFVTNNTLASVGMVNDLIAGSGSGEGSGNLQSVLDAGSEATINDKPFQITVGGVSDYNTLLYNSGGDLSSELYFGGSNAEGVEYTEAGINIQAAEVSTILTMHANSEATSFRLGLEEAHSIYKGISANSVAPGIQIRDSMSNKGLIYSDDYSANFTDRSIVDKAYVDSVAGGGGSTPTLQSVVTAGSSASVTDKELSLVAVDEASTSTSVLRLANFGALLTGYNGVDIQASGSSGDVNISATDQINLQAQGGINFNGSIAPKANNNTLGQRVTNGTATVYADEYGEFNIAPLLGGDDTASFQEILDSASKATLIGTVASPKDFSVMSYRSDSGNAPTFLEINGAEGRIKNAYSNVIVNNTQAQMTSGISSVTVNADNGVSVAGNSMSVKAQTVNITEASNIKLESSAAMTLNSGATFSATAGSIALNAGGILEIKTGNAITIGQSGTTAPLYLNSGTFAQTVSNYTVTSTDAPFEFNSSHSLRVNGRWALTGVKVGESTTYANSTDGVIDLTSIVGEGGGASTAQEVFEEGSTVQIYDTPISLQTINSSTSKSANITLSNTLGQTTINGDTNVFITGDNISLHASADDGSYSAIHTGAANDSANIQLLRVVDDKLMAFGLGDLGFTITDEVSHKGLRYTPDPEREAAQLFDANAIPSVGTVRTIANQAVNEAFFNYPTPETTKTLELYNQETYYTYASFFDGIWTLPEINGNIGKKMYFITTFDGKLTLNTDSSTNTIWSAGTLSNTIEVPAGTVREIYNNGSYWIVLR